MKRFLFGFDRERPEECARALRNRGVDAVVTGSLDPRGEEALAEAGLELYLCFGALGVSPEDGESLLARDAEGRTARWFSSGCPNARELRERHLEAAIEALRRTPTARGLFVDGARFASFASPEGPASFYTCFCPRCEAAMRAQGFDPEALRRSVLRFSLGQAKSEDLPGLRDWLAFRAATVRDNMEAFAAAVHGLPGDKLAGAFVFAPSLAGFVGQTPFALASLDLVSPMLYRAYPHPEGPACLGHEWAAALELCGPEDLRRLDLLSCQVSGLPGLFPEADAPALRREGFPPERVGQELELLAGRLDPNQRLLPILQIEDPRLPETVQAALSAGAQGVGFFAYGQAPLETLPPA